MPNYRPCADGSIDRHIKNNHPGAGPQWSDLSPKILGLTKTDWAAQSDVIADQFNVCIGKQIDFPKSERGKFHDKILGGFSDYLVEKAEEDESKASIIALGAEIARLRDSKKISRSKIKKMLAKAEL
jgi:hypothetical protein